MFDCRRGIVLGVEADVTFPNYSPSIRSSRLWRHRDSDVVEQMDYVGSLRGRLGYAAGHWLFYATGGLAFAGERFINTPAVGSDEKNLDMRLGWAAGAGVEYAFAPHWSLRLEYLYSQFRERRRPVSVSDATIASTLEFPVAAGRPQPQDRLAGQSPR